MGGIASDSRASKYDSFLPVLDVIIGGWYLVCDKGAAWLVFRWFGGTQHPTFRGKCSSSCADFGVAGPENMRHTQNEQMNLMITSHRWTCGCAAGFPEYRAVGIGCWRSQDKDSTQHSFASFRALQHT